MREKGGSGTFARRIEEALTPLLFYAFVIPTLYLSLCNKSLTFGLYHSSLLIFIPPYPHLSPGVLAPRKCISHSKIFLLKNDKHVTLIRVGCPIYVTHATHVPLILY